MPKLSKSEYAHRMIVVTPAGYYDAEVECRYCGPDCTCVVDPSIVEPSPEQVLENVAEFMKETTER